MSVEVGDTAPEFELPAGSGGSVALSALRGQNVVVVFYPLAFSGICTGELCGIRDDIGAFANDDVQVVAISIDSFFTQKAFAQVEGYDFPMLSDMWPHGAVAKAYGVFDDGLGVATRGTFVIDREGIVRHKVVNGIEDARDHHAVAAAVASLD